MTDHLPSKDLSVLYQWLIEKANDNDPYDSQMFTKAMTIVGERLAPETAPTAWMRGHRSYSPGEPDDYDVECVYGDDPPDDSGKWIPLYRRPAKPPCPVVADGRHKVVNGECTHCRTAQPPRDGQ
jgi:hypothetical protein